MNACERFMCLMLQCLNKTFLYCDNLPTNYTCPPFSGPVSVVLHFQVLQVVHFQRLQNLQSANVATKSIVLFSGIYTSNHDVVQLIRVRGSRCDISQAHLSRFALLCDTSTYSSNI